jgi:hypothetical protein
MFAKLRPEYAIIDLKPPDKYFCPDCSYWFGDELDKWEVRN